MQTRTKVALFFALALCAARVAHAAEAVCTQALAKPDNVQGKALSASELRFTWRMPAGGAACIDTFTYYVVEAGAADQSAAGAVSQSGALKCAPTTSRPTPRTASTCAPSTRPRPPTASLWPPSPPLRASRGLDDRRFCMCARALFALLQCSCGW